MDNLSQHDNSRSEIVVLKQDPSAMVQSLKGLAYTLKDALCDIIDNSIKAESDKIWIYAPPDQSYIAVIDNGYGMSAKELESAMAVFNIDPRNTRSDKDLGRFGMGMKTASLSQCNKFTVMSRSKKNGKASALTMDVEFIEQHAKEYNNLTVQRKDPEQLYGFVENIEPENFDEIKKHGTVVLWETLDIASVKGAEEASQTEYNELLTHSKNHISLVFHRFLEGDEFSNKDDSLQICWNGHKIKPFNPFNPSHSRKEGTNHYRIKNGNEPPPEMVLEGFTLPEETKVSSQCWQYYSGPQHSTDKEGYLDNQGFYVYRLKRLIAYGPRVKNWFGLQPPRPITQLSRVKVDINKDLDHEWGIELKKADLQPSFLIKQHLKAMINKITLPSKTIYRRRGTKLIDSNPLGVWRIDKVKGQFRYYIDQSNPVIEKFIEELKGDSLDERFEEIIGLVESTIPYSHIYSTMIDNKVFDHDEEQVFAIGKMYWDRKHDGLIPLGKEDSFWTDLRHFLISISSIATADKVIAKLKDYQAQNT